MLNKTMTAFALATTLALPSFAAAEQSNFIHSAIGPGQGSGTFGIAAKGYIVDDRDGTTVPTVDLTYLYGLTDGIDFEVRLNSAGLVNLLDAGIRVRIAGSQELSLAARLDATGLVAFDGAEQGGAKAAGGVTPGILLSTGNETFQLSGGLDVPVFLGVGRFGPLGAGSPGRVREVEGHVFRPWVGLEVAVSNGIALSAQAQVYMSSLDADEVLPAVAMGLNW